MKEKTISGNLSMRSYMCYLIITLFLLSAMTFLLSSCEKDEYLDNTAQVRFSIGNMSYSEDEMVTRSGAGAEKELEVIELALGNDWYMEATLVEESVSPTRALYDNIVDGAKFRVVVYDSNDDYVTDEEYVYDATKNEITGKSFKLTIGSQYTFVVYSYNTNDLPPAYNAAITVTPPFDLLWGAASETIKESGNMINVLLSHKFTRVKVKATVTGSSNPTITDIALKLSSNYTGDLTVFDGDLVKGTATSPQSLSEDWRGKGTNSVTNDYSIVYTAGDRPTRIVLTSLTIQGNTENRLSDYPVKFTQALVPSKSYELQVKIRKTIWAGSNIYWESSPTQDDPNNGYLTFKPAGYVGNENYYQGVHFQWGSLVGVSPEIIDYNNATIYIPTYESTNYTSSTWSSQTSSKKWTNFTSIPYMKNTVSNSGRESTHLIDAARNTDDLYKAYKGDICQYISKTSKDATLQNYRMPTSIEFGGKSANSYTWGVPSNEVDWYLGKDDINANNAKFNSVTGLNVAGKKMLDYTSGSGFGIYWGAVFPASGFRVGDPKSPVPIGTLSEVGTQGLYWSGSDNGSEYAYFLYFYKTFVKPGNDGSRQNGRSVRCVKKD
ncbi:MAG: hypothetical protein LBB85_02230 [Dysgonamonadaceae bacterium]|nr:hypothetical protein [Dysgonamonadaceae bacterium]